MAEPFNAYMLKTARTAHTSCSWLSFPYW